MNGLIHRVLLGTVLSLMSAAAIAQANSSAPYRMIIGFPPGQATDTVARLLAEKMGESLNTAIVVENRPGAGGSIALTQLARSDPDGKTLMLTSQSALVSNPHIHKDIKYDPLNDFESIGLVADLPLLMVTAADAPYDSVKEFLDQARAKPDTMTYASSGIGTTMHLYMLLLQRDTQLSMVHVPYQGSVAAVTDVIAGRVDLGFDTIPATLPLIKGGKLKLLGIGSNQPLSMLPDVESVGSQAGLPDFNASAWLGLIYPQGTPGEAIALMNEHLAQALEDPDVRNRMETLGAIPRLSSSDELATRIRDDYFRWKDIVQEFNIN